MKSADIKVMTLCIIPCKIAVFFATDRRIEKVRKYPPKTSAISPQDYLPTYIDKSRALCYDYCNL